MSEPVTIAFYRGGGDGCNEPLLNQATLAITGKFCHCEVVFTDTRTGSHNLSCGVWQNQAVYLKPKSFGRTNWTFKTLNLPRADVRTMRAWCSKQVGKPFNKWGFWRALTPFPRTTDETRWFCSELAVTAFQKIGYLQNVLASTVTPSQVFTLVTAMGSHVSASPLVDTRVQHHPLRFVPKKAGTLKMIRSWQPSE